MDNAKQILLEMLEKQGTFSSDNWLGSTFEKFKIISATEKGNIGEDFLAELLKNIGCYNVVVLSGRRGDYDVSFVEDNNKMVKFEVKVATQDTNKSFQFNGIRYDTKYTHLFCFGITPEDIYYLIVNKRDVGEDKYKMVSMQKGSNATYKLTRGLPDMNTFDNFENDIKGITL